MTIMMNSLRAAAAGRRTRSVTPQLEFTAPAAAATQSRVQAGPYSAARGRSQAGGTGRLLVPVTRDSRADRRRRVTVAGPGGIGLGDVRRSQHRGWHAAMSD